MRERNIAHLGTREHFFSDLRMGQDLAPANRMGMGIRTQSWTAMPPRSGCFTKHGHFLDFLDESKRSLQ